MIMFELSWSVVRRVHPAPNPCQQHLAVPPKVRGYRTYIQIAPVGAEFTVNVPIQNSTYKFRMLQLSLHGNETQKICPSAEVLRISCQKRC